MIKNDAFHPKKSLGQNFLINPRVVERIIEACGFTPDDIVLEIGPGKGALTHAISQRVKEVIAVEKDRELAQDLKESFKDTNVHIECADILKFSFAKLPANVKIIGNLPYNIATPIIEKVLKDREKFPVFFMTVQLEYGQRIAAQPNNKNYGSFSCFVQYYANPKILFKIGSSSFQPAPKVQSCFLRLDIPAKMKYKTDETKLFRIIRAAFGQRRKTIENSFSSAIEKKRVRDILEHQKIDPKQRAENLSLEDYIRIANAME